MRILGIDPSSSISGVAIIDTPAQVIDVGHWEREKGQSHPASFMVWFRWLESYIAIWQPHMAAIEMLSVDRNATTAKVIAFYQAVAATTCKLHGLVVVESRVSTSRKVVLGNGGLSKDNSWEIMRKRYPDLFSPKTRGGTDEMDALTVALAGESAAEH